MRSLPHVGRWVDCALRAAIPLLVLLVVLAGCTASDSVPGTTRFPAGSRPGTTQFWVNLRGRSNLQGAAEISDYAARGQFVMDELQRTAAATQGPVISFLEGRNARFEPFWVANVIWVEADDETRTLVANLPEVASVEPEQTIALDDPPVTAPSQPQVTRDASGLNIGQNVSRLNAPQVWNMGITGKGVVVGIMDTGFAPHPAINPRYRGYQNSPTSFNNKYNWYDTVGTPRCQTPCDGNGHGTHVTGTVVGRDGIDAIGVAPDAQFIACRALNNGGSGTGQTVVACLQWFLAPTDVSGANANSAMRPNIINMSLGSAGLPSGVADAMRSLRAAGTLPVAASGNSGGCGKVGYPAALGDVLAVGSLTADPNTNTMSAFTSTGPVPNDSSLIKPDVVAQGEAVRSAWLQGGYNTISGTSMASPSVAGVAALIMSSSTKWLSDPAGVAGLLMDTANSNVSPGKHAACSQMFGRGLVDANAAVNRALLLSPRRE